MREVMQAAIIPGTIGHVIKTREFKNGTTEMRIKYYQSPDWSGSRKPKLRRVL
jgi:hypothetical protein